eukprot:1715577-Amphidinium_carterae.2
MSVHSEDVTQGYMRPCHMVHAHASHGSHLWKYSSTNLGVCMTSSSTRVQSYRGYHTVNNDLTSACKGLMKSQDLKLQLGKAYMVFHSRAWL